MKLTKQLRRAIIANCVQHTFTERNDTLEQMRQELADILYERAFGTAARLAATLPKYWFLWRQDISIQCKGFTHWSNKPAEPRASLAMSRERPMPEHITEQFTIKPGDALAQRAEDIVKTHQSIYADRRKLELHLQTLLESVTTLEKLRTLWPEGESFFPPAPAKKDLPVPADLTKVVNKLMRLS